MNLLVLSQIINLFLEIFADFTQVVSALNLDTRLSRLLSALSVYYVFITY